MKFSEVEERGRRLRPFDEERGCVRCGRRLRPIHRWNWILPVGFDLYYCNSPLCSSYGLYICSCCLRELKSKFHIGFGKNSRFACPSCKVGRMQYLEP